jgi:hypothetical protein
VATKPSFRSAFKRRRCLAIADGFYEWKATAAKTKQPYHMHRPDDRPFAFAGLWERWEKGETPVEGLDERPGREILPGPLGRFDWSDQLELLLLQRELKNALNN